jgi:glycosyltransferase involved in cell wall biosynthesis
VNSLDIDLSIVIPAYNETRRLPQSLERIYAWLRSQPLGWEVIVVDDGSTDGTLELARQLAERYPNLRPLANGRNRGKGYSVRHGALEARGRAVLFTDADLSAPIEEAGKLMAAAREGYAVVVGSRAVDPSLIEIHQSAVRELAGKTFHLLVRLLTGLSLQDTQCGFKLFDREATRPIFERQKIERFGFDPEVLFLAKKWGLRIAEVGVRWSHDAESRVSLLRDGWRMFLELVRLRWNWFRGRYR